MANLKSLLDKAMQEDFDPNNPSMPKYKYDDCTVAFATTCGVDHRRDECKHEFCWTPEPDINFLRIEMWGGGGGGAGVCCCMWGFGAGAGAYSRLDCIDIRTCKTEYRICIAPPACCSPNRDCGYRGCKTYINNGYLRKADGTTAAPNFCAEGGQPGDAKCFMFECLDGQCTEGTSGCGTFMDPRYDSCCACWFDGDFGFPGKLGGIQTQCKDNNSCWYKHLNTIPGMLDECGYRYDFIRFCAYNHHGSFAGCATGRGLIGAGDSHHAAPGKGGSSASALGGNCYCGGPGGPGFVRINLK